MLAERTKFCWAQYSVLSQIMMMVIEITIIAFKAHLRVLWTARSNQSILKEQLWIRTGRTDAKAEASILWPPNEKGQFIGKRLWCLERLKAGGEMGDIGWEGQRASPTQWTWVWASSRRQWRTGRPGMLQFMGSQRVGHYWATELNWSDWIFMEI